jgi:superfamily II DNA or RNA helicase
MSRLENLTSHQMEIYKECSEHKKVHLSGPAGCGKTYLAVRAIRENMKSDDPKQVIFLTKNESLCMHIIQLLSDRGRDNQMINKLKK